MVFPSGCCVFTGPYCAFVAWSPAQIHSQLAPIAAAIVDDVHRAAECGDVPLETLIRSRRHEDARRHADLATNVATLRELFRIRNAIWGITAADVTPINVSEYHDLVTYTSPVQLSQEKSEAARWHSIYSRGGRLWFPTKDQIKTRAAELQPAHEVAQEQIERARRASFA